MEGRRKTGFRGLCFSDPVKLVRDGQWTERYFAEAADWGANEGRFFKAYLQGKAQ